MVDQPEPVQREQIVQLEQNRFNTGPKAPKCYPTMNTTSVVNDENAIESALQPINEDSFDGQLKILNHPIVNELSNLSSAGSGTDSEPKTPGKLTATSASEKKSQRKRKRAEETPKSERKITELFKNASPKRVPLVPVVFNSHEAVLEQKVNKNVVFLDHHQSPPKLIVRAKADKETETDEIAAPVGVSNIANDYKRLLDEAQVKLNVERRRNEICREEIRKLMIEKNTVEKRAIRDKTDIDQPRIGQYQIQRFGGTFKEVFVDGTAFEEIHKRANRLNTEKNELNNAAALLKKRKPTGGDGIKRSAASSLTAQLNSVQTDNAGPSTSVNNDDALFRRPDEPKEISIQEYIETDEIYKLRKDYLKKEEQDLLIEREKLEKEKQLHMRELRRAYNEYESRYKEHNMLSNNRYLFLSMLGKGGFSEVWRAYDLEENRYVACKIHHVNKDWKEEKKANYVKHAMREKEIHKSLDHSRVVKLFEIFTIDSHSFCSVQEYCPGNDLDFYLKQNKTIPEKEARSIIMQLVSALVYFNDRKPQIIHYDLKPANILLENGTTSGAIKITDFGLSKFCDDQADDMELTSQFAGTYWYLPPETFMAGPNSRINTKVDVWSVGVIFYQCIYGRKPFGNEQTQQKILEDQTMMNAHANDLKFPAKPALSSVAQDFIVRCLQNKKEDRADAYELAKHELFKPVARGGRPPSSPSTPSTPFAA